MTFVFIIGFVPGGITTYVITKLAQRPVRIPEPSPVEPTAEASTIKGSGEGRQAPIPRRPTAGTVPTKVVVTKTGDAYHR